MILICINLILLFLGCFLDTGVIILLVTPIFLTIATSVGVSPLALGLIMVINTSAGMITPPMAVNLYIAARISGCGIEEIAKSIIPYLIVEIVFILILSNFSGILEFLPRLLD
jgi:C4-dicarboxylate transporter DctM subunit